MNGNKKLKCYFAFSNDIIGNKIYEDMLVACLNSARTNTTLDLNCLYDGKENDNLCAILNRFHVKTKIIRIPFEEELYSLYTPEYMQKKLGYVISKSSLRGRFLRFLISEIETEDDYVLYCDTDVLFLKDFSLKDFKILPKYVLAGPEFKKDELSYFNAGVMLLNTAEARNTYKNFCHLLKEKKYAQCFECCDQGYLNDLYKNKFDPLPLEFNWKPQWGKNDNVKIIHFHGIKPNSLNFTPIDWLNNLKEVSYSGFYYYYHLFCQYAGIDKSECLNRLTWTLMCCQKSKQQNQKRKRTTVERVKRIFISLIPIKSWRKKLRKKYHV